MQNALSRVFMIKELLTVVLEKTLESPLDCKEIQPVHSKEDQSLVFFGRNDAKAKTPILWPPHAKSWLIGKDWCWEGLGAGGEGDDIGWDGWVASLTRWMWVWVNSRSWWWTGRPGFLKSMGSQRVRHDWAIELNGFYLRSFPSAPSGKEPTIHCGRPKRCGHSCLGQGYPLEKGMSTCSNILVWIIPWTEEPGCLQSIGSQRVRPPEVT